VNQTWRGCLILSAIVACLACGPGRAADCPNCSPSPYTPSCQPCGGPYILDLFGDWVHVDFSADYLNMRRDKPAPFSLATLSDLTTAVDTRNLSTEDADFEDRVGYRLSLGVSFGCSFAIEGVYTHLNSFNSSATIVNPAPTTSMLASPFLNLAGIAVPSYQFTYNSDLHSDEINARWLLGNGDSCLSGSLLSGFRYFKIDEGCALSGTTVGGGAVLSSETTASSTRNELFGYQMGGDMTLAWGQVIYFSLFAKAGIYVNETNSQIRNVFGTAATSPFVRLDTARNEAGVAASVEMGAMMNIRFCECGLLRFGYQVLYVGGLALAPEQLASNQPLFDSTIRFSNIGSFPRAPAELNHDGNITYHGFFAGLELAF
jgi:hypothetical protein